MCAKIGLKSIQAIGRYHGYTYTHLINVTYML